MFLDRQIGTFISVHHDEIADLNALGSGKTGSRFGGLARRIKSYCLGWPDNFGRAFCLAFCHSRCYEGQPARRAHSRNDPDVNPLLLQTFLQRALAFLPKLAG